MFLKYIQNCRICGNPHLSEVLNLGEHFLHGAFETQHHQPSRRKVPIKILRCDNTQKHEACGLVQLSIEVPPEILYSSYFYRSGVSETMRNHLKLLVDKVLAFCGPNKIKWVLDIGANDLTTLSYFPSFVQKVGIDPSDIIIESKKQNPEHGKITTFNETYPSPSLNNFIRNQTNQGINDFFDCIFSIACLYDVSDLDYFVSNIANHLKFDGVWCFEVAYLPAVLENLAYDGFVAEHISTFSLATLEILLAKHRLKVVYAEETPTNGGSLLIFATHSDHVGFDTEKNKKTVIKLRKKEFDLEIDTNEPFDLFRFKVQTHRNVLKDLLHHLKTDGKRIHILGASTKLNLLLDYCGIDNNIIDFAAERDERKFGGKLLNGIPIISEQESRNMEPNYYLVGPYHFMKEIIEREEEIIRNGTELIFPLPEIKVIDSCNYKDFI